MEKIYVFKVALKHRKGLWRRIEIKGDQTLGDFDSIIRNAFDHDVSDHLSEFFREQWPRGGFGEIDSFGGGEGADNQIERLGLSEGEILGYVYDFGDEIYHIITLEKIVETEEIVKYPRVISKNKQRFRYCETCKKQGKKTVATWICYKCSEDEGRNVLLCEDCMDEHEDHYAEEILY